MKKKFIYIGIAITAVLAITFTTVLVIGLPKWRNKSTRGGSTKNPVNTGPNNNHPGNTGAGNNKPIIGNNPQNGGNNPQNGGNPPLVIPQNNSKNKPSKDTHDGGPQTDPNTKPDSSPDPYTKPDFSPELHVIPSPLSKPHTNPNLLPKSFDLSFLTPAPFREYTLGDIPYNLTARWINAKADGHCMYHSLIMFTTNPSSYQSLRNLVADYADANWDNLVQDNLPTVLDYKTKEAYINAVKGNEWGTHYELHLYSKITNQNVIVANRGIERKTNHAQAELVDSCSPNCKNTILLELKGCCHYNRLVAYIGDYPDSNNPTRKKLEITSDDVFNNMDDYIVRFPYVVDKTDSNFAYALAQTWVTLPE